MEEKKEDLDLLNEIANKKVIIECQECGFKTSIDTLENNVNKIGLHLCK